MKPIKIFGHKTPDTDTVVSAIAYAWYYKTVKNNPAEAFVLGDLNKETRYVLDRFSIDTPRLLPLLGEEDRIVIVDTNNIQELPKEIELTEIIEIVDHHKLSGGITTKSPISITLRPMASTASLIYTIMNPELHPLPKNMAGIMLAALISDTLEFRSPTTTQEDIAIGDELAKIAGVNISELAHEMFKRKSDISDVSSKDLLLSDSKVFTINGRSIRVSVIETTKTEEVLNRASSLVEKMQKLTLEDDTIDDILLFVINILEQEATPIVSSKDGQRLVEESFSVIMPIDAFPKLKGIVSRKKQIIPALLK